MKSKLTKVKPTYIREDERGSFIEIINSQRWENISYGALRKGSVIGNHYHKETIVFFFLLDGDCVVEIKNVKTGRHLRETIQKNQGIILTPYLFHQIIFLKSGNYILAKSKKFDFTNTDIYSL